MRIHHLLPCCLLTVLWVLNCSQRPDTRELGYYYIHEEDGVEDQGEETPAPEPKVEPDRAPVINKVRGVEFQTGKAWYYSDRFQGSPTANGELYDRNKLTGGHRTFPFDRIVRVTNLANGKSVEVRINDRGPHEENRIIDISFRAMNLIGGIGSGAIDVKVELLPEDE